MVYSGDVKEQALALIKYLYKNMPTYNQIKGTYLGIQYVLNMLGLCTSITEIWSDRAQETLKNFAESSDHLFRAEELNDLRENIAELANSSYSGNAQIKNFFLTSRFDIDLVNTKYQTFKSFNEQAAAIIQVVNQIKPVTRALRKLYYIIRITTELSVQHISITDKEDRKIFAYTYAWNIDTPLSREHTIFDVTTQQLYQIYLPFNSDNNFAKCLGYYALKKPVTTEDTEDTESTEDTENTGSTENTESSKWQWHYEGYPKYTSACTYFTLNNAGYKFKVSKQDTFTFALISCGKYYYYTYPIGTDDGVNLYTDPYGITVVFNGTSKTVIQQFLDALHRTEPIESLYDIPIQFKSYFNLVHETNYLYQDPDRFEFELAVLIFENDENGTEPKIIAPETGQENTVYVSEEI